MSPTGENIRVVQVHPTRICNLRCLHCYSSSGPEERDELHVDLLRAALIDARDEGYNVLGVSGGEPLLYGSLRALLDQARACGMATTVTSNGMLLDERRIERLQGAVDILAISLDGVPESHNRMRNSNIAFDTMLSRLEGVRRSGIPFGFIFTLTLHNVHELHWVAKFALSQGAKLLQVHPLEIAGRANERMSAARPDDTEAAFAYLEVARIQKLYNNAMQFQLDLVDRNLICNNACRVFADDFHDDPSSTPLAELVSPLVIEPDGTMVPVQYGFSRRYALGNLTDSSLRDLAVRWRRDLHTPFRKLCRAVFEKLVSPSDLPLANWYEFMSQEARKEELRGEWQLGLPILENAHAA